MPIHWTGRVCKMDKVISIAKKCNLTIIKDFAKLREHIIIINMLELLEKFHFSTHPLKNLNALGDSDFVITNNKKLYEKINISKSWTRRS